MGLFGWKKQHQEQRIYCNRPFLGSPDRLQQIPATTTMFVPGRTKRLPSHQLSVIMNRLDKHKKNRRQAEGRQTSRSSSWMRKLKGSRFLASFQRSETTTGETKTVKGREGRKDILLGAKEVQEKDCSIAEKKSLIPVQPQGEGESFEEQTEDCSGGTETTFVVGAENFVDCSSIVSCLSEEDDEDEVWSMSKLLLELGPASATSTANKRHSRVHSWPLSSTAMLDVTRDSFGRVDC